MPLVGYNCKKHGYFDCFHKFEDVYKGECPVCGSEGSRVWEPSMFVVDFRDGFDPGLGEYVATKRQRDNLVAERNLRRVRD